MNDEDDEDDRLELEAQREEEQPKGKLKILQFVTEIGEFCCFYEKMLQMSRALCPDG